MTVFLIPREIAEQITDAVYGPGSSLNPGRVEIVSMALHGAAADLYRAWAPQVVPCPSRSCFGVVCELTSRHDGFHKGHIGSTPAAWDDGKYMEVRRNGDFSAELDSVPLPASIATEATS